MDRLTPQPLYQGERIALTTEQETGWTPQPAGTLWRRYNSFAPTRIRTLDRPVRSLVTKLARQSNDACRTCCWENSTVKFPLPCPARPVTQMTPRCVSRSCVVRPPIGILETQFWRLCVRLVHTAQLCVQQQRELDLEAKDRRTASTGQKPSREANSSSASQRNSPYLWNTKFHYRVQNSPPIVVFRARIIQPTASLPIYSISIWVLSPIYALDFTMVPLLQVFQPKHCMHLSSPAYMLHVPPI